MKESGYLKYQILLFVKNINRSYNTHQLEHAIGNQIIDFENYQNYFSKAFDYLKDNSFINTGINNKGTDTVSSLTEKGEAVLKFDSWEEYIQSLELAQQKEREIKNIDFELKKTTLKNQKFMSYTSIAGLVFGLGSMIWSIMEKYDLVFVDITIYFLILISLLLIGIILYKKS